MTRSRLVSSTLLLLAAAACSSDHGGVTQPATISPELAGVLNDGFAQSAAGFGETNNSFVAGLDAFAPWMPPAFGATMDRFHRTSDFMGGGLADDFDGAGAFATFGHGPFDGGPFAPIRANKNCTFSSSTGRVTCPSQTIGGLTINRSYAYTDVNNKPQAALDTTTNTVNTRVTVSGTIVFRRGDTTTVNHASDQTVTGLAKGSAKRVINGTSGGTEDTKGTDDKGNKFTTARIIGDTTTGLTIPVQSGKPTYPTAGSVVRSMQVTATIGSQAPAKSSRREVITYDGSATAKVTITHDGTTKNCTLPLPRGRLNCS
jgi:hypothetical protein